MVACTNSQLEIARALIASKANISKENQDGMTPLHAACLSGNIRIVDLLLDQPDADFMKKDNVRSSHLIPCCVAKLHSVALCGDQGPSEVNQTFANSSLVFDPLAEVLLAQ